MTGCFRRYVAVALHVTFVISTQRGLAQGFGTPLQIQGLDHTTLLSAASRGAGGLTVGLRNDIGIMFANPAALQSLEGLQVSIGARLYSSKAQQDQQYGPAKYYPNFSLVMDGLTDLVPDTQLDTLTSHTAKDSVQRPYDTLGPDWSHSRSRTLPLQAMVAVPFTLGSVKAVIGVGAVEYANLDWFFQNNNVLSPAVNVQRPVPVPLVKNDSLSLPVRWYQYSQTREGSLYGYGAALSFAITDELSCGFSGMLLKGSADDLETTVGRGRLVFYSSYFRLDSVDYRSRTTGTSDFSGEEYTLSGIYRGKFLSLGFAIKPPSTITRTFTSVVQSDSVGISTSMTTSGEDKVKLPWRGMAGISLALKENFSIGLEYEIRSYASAVYTGSDGAETNPWLSYSLLRFGAEYAPFPWLTLRAGVRDQAEVFQPEGTPLEGEPVSYAVYSGGCGLTFSGIRLNLTYEYLSASYTDIFVNNVNLNSDSRHSVVVDLSYSLPWRNAE